MGLFALGDFRRLWLIGLATFVVRWLELLVFGLVAWRETGSSFVVAMLTLARLLPMGLFGAFIGAWADRIERRSAMMIVVASLLCGSATLGILATTGQLAVWQLFIAAFLNGIGWAADNPVRRMMLGEVVGAPHMGLAMAIDIGTNNVSRMLGPTLGGVLLAGLGIAGCFALSVVLYVAALIAALGLGYRNGPGAAGGEAVLARVLDGVRLAVHDPRLRAIFLVTILYNLFGWPYTSMVPVIAEAHLHLSTENIGYIASLDGTGAFIGAILMALLCRPAFYRTAYVGGCTIYFTMVVAFALSPHALPAGTALLLLGIGGSGYSIMQNTLVYLAAPPEMRSRALGVLSVCIGLGPIGFVNLGLLADWLGPATATAAIGVEGLIAIALCWPLWRRI